MGFTSISFLFVFLPISLILYLPICRIHSYTARNIYLVICSFVFYLWAGVDTFLIFLLYIFVCFLLGQLIFSKKQSARIWLAVGIVIVSCALVNSKYLTIFLQAIKASNSLIGSNLLALLFVPLGFSFISFEAISYFVDIYRGDAKPGNFLDVLLFFSIYPKLISGPIVLWKDFSPQIYTHQTTPDCVKTGLTRIIIGYSKKVILADSLGTVLTLINTTLQTGIDTKTLWLRSLIYMFQLYFDFSGYSDIAIGIMNVYGFSVKPNFRTPYASLSVSEFWRRWHISLGTWFREYVYFPMGGSKKGNVYLHLLVVFLLTGCWHGSNWTFVLWGILHGLWVILERLAEKHSFYKAIPNLLKWLITMVFIFFTWLLFMSDNLQTFWHTLRAMFTPSSNPGYDFSLRYYLTPKTISLLSISAVVSILPSIQKPYNHISSFFETSHWGSITKDIVLLLLLAISVLFVVNSAYSPFLYFQF